LHAAQDAVTTFRIHICELGERVTVNPMESALDEVRRWELTDPEIDHSLLYQA
jgi:hypothetical protein